MSPATPVSKDQLLQDLKAVVADAEALLKATAAAHAEPGVQDLRARLQARLDAARAGADAVKRQLDDSAEAVDRYVHDHPWPAVGIAAGIGLIAGLLLSRR